MQLRQVVLVLTLISGYCEVIWTQNGKQTTRCYMALWRLCCSFTPTDLLQKLALMAFHFKGQLLTAPQKNGTNEKHLTAFRMYPLNFLCRSTWVGQQHPRLCESGANQWPRTKSSSLWGLQEVRTEKKISCRSRLLSLLLHFNNRKCSQCCCCYYHSSPASRASGLSLGSHIGMSKVQPYTAITVVSGQKRHLPPENIHS